MDVGNPGNFVRVMELFQQQFSSLTAKVSSYSISDDETRATIKNVFTIKNYLADPHGAVAYLALEKYLHTHPGEKGIFLETAHPVKFYNVIDSVLNEKIEIPAPVQTILHKEKVSTQIEAKFGALKEILMHL